MGSVKDEMTNKVSLVATLRESVRVNGAPIDFTVSATCSESGLDIEVTNPHEYKLTNSAPRPKVEARVAIDGRVTEAVSNIPDYKNEVRFSFTRKASDEGTELWSTLLKGAAGGSVTDISPDEFYAAKTLKIEMPLANGALPIVEFHPQDPEFQKFATRCRAGDAGRARAKNEETAKKDAAVEATKVRHVTCKDVDVYEQPVSSAPHPQAFGGIPKNSPYRILQRNGADVKIAFPDSGREIEAWVTTQDLCLQ